MNSNGLQDELEFLLAETNALANRLKLMARAIHAEDGLPAGGKIILQIISEGSPQTVPQIARRRGLSRQNIQVLGNRLEADGWLVFVDNPAHKRSDLLQLTARGETLLAAASAREAAFLAGLLKHTTEREVLSAGKLLSRLRALLEGRAPTVALPIRPPARIRLPRKSRKIALKAPTPSLENKVPLTVSEPAEDELPVSLL